MLTDRQIKEAAFDWAVDYKPWDETLSPQEYARYGYEEGYRRAQQDILRKLGLTQVKEGV